MNVSLLRQVSHQMNGIICLGVMMRKYAVMHEVDYGEWMYATHENPFTYNSDPIIFESFSLAEDYAKRFNSSTVVVSV
jgi:hypothetical protein